MKKQKIDEFDVSQTKTQEILDLLKQGKKIVKFGFSKPVSLILGNTGSGKSTLTQFLLGDNNNLLSEETYDGSQEYIITDKNATIGRSTNSMTSFPRAMVQQKTNKIFYDCPGFDDNRSAANDIAANYFIKKVLDSSEATSFIFTIGYHAVSVGVDKNGFRSLVKHACTLIKDVNKFKDSIALIVTKVTNIYYRKNNSFHLTSDEVVIEGIAKFLEEVKIDLSSKITEKTNEVDKALYQNQIDFIDILLKKKNNYYLKIGIFRRPDEPGRISEVTLLQEGKRALEKIIFENTKFTMHSAADFGYTLSSDSLLYVDSLMKEINENMIINIKNIGKEINDYLEVRESHVTDLSAISKLFADAYVRFAKIQVIAKQMDTKNVIKLLIEDAISLNISISSNNILQILQSEEYLNFFSTIAERKTNSPLDWSQGMSKTLKYLEQTKKWYQFLIKLNNNLSQFSIQQNPSKYHNAAEKLQSQLANNIIDYKNLKAFLQELFTEKSVVESYLDNIVDMTFNKYKINVLNKILKANLQFGVTYTCLESNKLLIHGQYIKLSDVVNAKCQKEIKSFEIIALEKIIIDTNLNYTGKEVQIFIVAPTWEVFRDPIIMLNGMPGAFQSKASDGVWMGENGENGRPGLPGGTGGSLLGIGGNFINDEHLNISSNGGNGGDGQVAGNGKKGQDGYDAQNFTRNNDEFDRESWWFAVPVVGWAYLGLKRVVRGNQERTYTLRGTFGQKGGDGGDGGGSGLGGYAGQILTIGLFQKPHLVVTALNGKDGISGKGGFGELGGRHGRDYQITVYGGYMEGEVVVDSYWGRSKNRGYYLDRYPPKAGDGMSGIAGANLEGRKLPERNHLTAPYHIINKFKQLARQNLKDNPKALNLKEFIDKLEISPQITKLYDTMGLVEDLQYLENQFYILNTKISLMPYYKFLLNRIQNYSKNPDKNENNYSYQKVRSYLYTATLSKICYFNNNLKNDLVIDLYKYLDTTIHNINSFKETYKLVKIKEFQQEYQKSLTEKTSEAKNLIDSQILPTINKLFIQMENKVSLLINETATLRKDKIQEIYGKIELQHKLSNALSMEMLLSPLKIVEKILRILGPVGELLSGTMENFTTGIKNAVNEMADVLKNGRALLVEQLKDVEEYLNELEDSNGLTQLITPKFKEMYQKFNSTIKNEEVSNPLWINTTRNEIVNFFTSQNNLLEANGDPNQKIIKNILDTISITKIDINTYKKFKNDQDKVAFISEEITKINTQITKITLFEQEVYKVLIPLYKKMKNNLSEIKKDAHKKSHVVLDVKKWQIQSYLNEIKFKIRKLIKGFNIEEDFLNTIQNLEGGLTAIINIFDRVQDYKDISELSTYITHIISADAIADTGELGSTISQLELIIKSNIVLEQYDKAITALKQNVFPYAKMYLPPAFMPENDTVDIAAAAGKNIEYIKNLLSVSGSVINKNKEELHEMEFSSHRTTPFFVWTHEANKNSITNLLDGNIVGFKADVTKSLQENAIKFKQIGIHLQLRNQLKQKEFDKVLEDINISMTHTGYSYYRCNNRFFLITSSPQTFVYSFKKDENGHPLNYNTVYSDIKQYDYVLSPYTMWLIQLVPATWVNSSEITNIFHKLEQYKEEIIDLELEGTGQYVKEGAFVCNENLEEYYKLDDTLSELNNIDLEILQNSERVGLDNSDNQGESSVQIFRKRRNKDSEKVAYATSGSSSTSKSSFINNFASMVGFALNSIIHINPFKLSINNKITDNNSLVSHTNTSNRLDFKPDTDHQNIVNKMHCNFPSIQENLLLIDMIVRKKYKNNNQNKCVNNFINNVDKYYAQKLAYQGYL